MEMHKKLINRELTTAVEKIVSHYPHLAIVAKSSARSFAVAACSLSAAPNVVISDYWKLSKIANESDRRFK